MLKNLIAGTVATPKVKRFWSHISDSLQQKSLYATVGTVIALLPELQKEDLIAQTIQEESTIPNVNVHSRQSGEPWSGLKECFNKTVNCLFQILFELIC